jgi:hypothetical protein
VVFERGGLPSIYTRVKAVRLSIFSMEEWDTPTQHGAMPPLKEAVAEARQEGPAAPRERPVHDRAASPLPLRGRPWAGHGSVP